VVLVVVVVLAVLVVVNVAVESGCLCCCCSCRCYSGVVVGVVGQVYSKQVPARPIGVVDVVCRCCC
jgi:hypothetical protein